MRIVSDSLCLYYVVGVDQRQYAQGKQVITAMTRKPMTSIGSFVVLSAIVSFFGFHIVSGERGLMARPGLDLKIVQAEEKLALLYKHQRFLQQRIALLHSGSVDADILAETARSELGLYGPNDVIISIDMSDLKF